MFSPAIGRLVWREYRVMRGFWISLGIVALLMFQWPMLLRELQDYAGPKFAVEWAIALCLPLVYLVGATATAFNREHENGTYAMFRQSPLSARHITAAKLGFAILSTILLLVTISAVLIALQQLGWLPANSFHLAEKTQSRMPSALVQWVLYLGLVVGISTLASIYIRHPLTAVGVAGVAVLCVNLLVNPSFYQLSQPAYRQPHAAGFPIVFQLVLAAVGGVTLLAAWQSASTWLDEQPARLPRLRSPRRALPATMETGLSGALPLRFSRYLGRVLWLDRWKLAFFLVLAVFGSLFILNAVIASAILGGTLFAWEQHSNHKRFLVERGMSGLRVWMLRHLIGLSFVAIAVLPSDWLGHLPTHRFYSGLLAAPLLAYAAGHLCSLFLKSRIHAMAGTVLINLVTIPVVLFLSSLLMPHWLIGLLPFFAMMLVGMLRANGWLIDRNDWRAWRVPGITLALMVPLWLVVANVFRATELPTPPKSFAASLFVKPVTTAEERYLENVIERISLRASSTGEREIIPAKDLVNYVDLEETQWLEEHADLLTPELYQSIEQLDTLSVETRRLVALLVANARRHQVAGRLDEAWNDYRTAIKLCFAHRASGDPASIGTWSEEMILHNGLLWAAQRGQTPERIQTLLNELGRLSAHPPRVDLMAKQIYTEQRKIVDGLTESLDAYGEMSPIERLAVQAWLWQPGEQIRIRRWMDRDLYAALEWNGLESRDLSSIHRPAHPWEAGLLLPPNVDGTQLQLLNIKGSYEELRTQQALTQWALMGIQHDFDWKSAKLEEVLPTGVLTGSQFQVTRGTQEYAPFVLPLREINVDVKGETVLASERAVFYLPPKP